ncbi:MAG: proton-conducting transporter membrane subunit [Patescibacteria group bacterium]
MTDFFLSLWRFDVLTQYALILLAIVTVGGALVSLNTLRQEIATGIIGKRDTHRFAILGILCVIGFAAALLTKNILVLWIALEIVTVCTALVIAFYKRPNSGQAAWNYIRLSTIGVIVMFVGLIFLVKIGIATGLSPWDALSLDALRVAAPNFSAPTLKIAFALIFLGFGTKMGLVPLHTWAAEAYSKISSPMSGFLAAMLPLTVLIALLRIRQIVDTNLNDGGTWTGRLFLVFGIVSIVVTALTLIRQKNYKRMTSTLALHHSGLTVFMIGLGPAGMIPALIHAFTQALVTSGLFAATGIIHGTYKTSKFSGVQNMLSVLPTTAVLMMILAAAALAVPFSGFFTSEVVGLGYGLQENFWVTLLALIAVILAAACLLRFVLTMLLPSTEAAPIALQPGQWKLSNAVLALHVLIIFALGAYVSTQSGIRVVITAVQTVGGL